MKATKIALVIFFMVNILAVGLMAEDIVAHFEGGEISRAELEKAISVLPWHIQDKYVLGDDYSHLAEVYAIGKSLTEEQVNFVLEDEQVARTLDDKKESILSRTLYEKEIDKKIEISEEEMKQYYEENKEEQFHTPERYKIKHIFISTYEYAPKEHTVEEGESLYSISKKYLDTDHYAPAIRELNDMEPGEKIKPGDTIKIPYTWSGDRVPIEDEEILETRREWAEYIRALAVRPDTNFSELAKEYSQTDQEDKGAIIGPIPDPRAPKPLLAEIKEALQDMEPGEISPVIRTKHGFEIIKLVEIIPEETKSFEEAERQIRSRLRREKQQVRVEEYLEELQKAPFITTYYEEILEQEDIAEDAVLLEVGDFTKTYGDVRKAAQQNPGLQEVLHDSQQLEQYLQSIVIREAISKQARLDGIHKSEDFQEQYSAFKAITMGDRYLEKKARQLSDETEVDEETLKNYYEEIKNDFYQPARYQVAQISRKIENSESETRQLLQEAYEELQAGEAFAQVAEQYSTDAYVDKGGQVGFIREDARSREYMETVKSLESGNYSEPVRIQDAYYIIQLLDQEDSYTQPFEEVMDQVERRYHSRQYREKHDNLKKTMLEEIGYDPAA